jgi:hypothetical protein
MHIFLNKNVMSLLDKYMAKMILCIEMIFDVYFYNEILLHICDNDTKYLYA